MKLVSKKALRIWAAVLAAIPLGFWMGRESGGFPPGSARPDSSETLHGASSEPPVSRGGLKATVAADPLPRTTLRPLFEVAGRVVEGQARPLASTQNPQTFKGRTLLLKLSQPHPALGLERGAEITLPGFDGESLTGLVNLRLEDNGWIRVGGRLTNGEDQADGTFSLHFNRSRVFGTMLFPQTGMAREIRTEPNGDVVLVERTLSQLMCWPVAAHEPAAAAAATDAGSPGTGASAVPQIHTRPGAKGLIYLNFSGGIVTDPDWNAGEPLTFAPSGLDATGIQEVVARVAEDFAPFDIAITTQPGDYARARPGTRMRVMITPTNTLLPTSGGVSLIGSWSESGNSRSETVPAWVFNSSVKSIAEAVSHEVGHTLGLYHDGTKVDAYYGGNAGTLGPQTSWAPIMGMSYYRALTQWSKGDYPNANNTEDDLAIIARSSNGFGYAADAPGRDADTTHGVRLLNVLGGTFSTSGVVRHSDADETFQFSTRGGSFSAAARPAVQKVSNVDLELELQDDSGGRVLSSNLTDTQEAALRVDSLPAGTYRLLVRAAPNVSPTSEEAAFRYPSYGSLGPYQLSGSLQNAVPMPEVLSPLLVWGAAGRAFLHRVTLSSGANLDPVAEPLPAGLQWDPLLRTFSGTPAAAGEVQIQLVVSNPAGQVRRTLKICLEEAALPIPATDGVLDSAWTTPGTPWIGQVVNLPSGSEGIAAASGRIPNGGSSRLRMRLPAQRSAYFWWKTSTEAAHDALACRLNGAVARDADTGLPLVLSGETGWRRQHLRSTSTGPVTVEFIYSKDASLSEGVDRGWVAGLEVGIPPVFKKHPPSLRLKPTDSSFSLECAVENANTYQWKKDGVPLQDGAWQGRSIQGSASPKLEVRGVAAADSGAYTLEARNDFDWTTSRKADISVPLPPVILGGMTQSGGAKVGDTLTLSAQIVGAPPISVTWWKDGKLFRRVNGSTLQIPNATAATSGEYAYSVSNPYGLGGTGTVRVVVPAQNP